MKKNLTVLVMALGAGSISAMGYTEPYPTKPIRVIVPLTPGGSTDIMARIIGDGLQKRLGQPLVVYSYPGRGGNRAMELVAKAAPDGYTLSWANVAPNAINATLYKNLSYDHKKDFAPIALVVRTPHIILANPAVRARTVSELIELAKKSPAPLTYAAGGEGNLSHLAGEYFANAAGIKLALRALASSPAAILALEARQVDLTFTGIPVAHQQIMSKRVVPIAITTLERYPLLPDVPTVAESGLPGFEANSWNGVLAPAGTPKAIISRLNKEIVEIVRSPDVNQKISQLGFTPVGSTPEEFRKHIAIEIDKWAKVINAGGIQPPRQ
jgi:tripartite-type tricarboxylate transporter receptor subunit TctC